MKSEWRKSTKPNHSRCHHLGDVKLGPRTETGSKEVSRIYQCHLGSNLNGHDPNPQVFLKLVIWALFDMYKPVFLKGQNKPHASSTQPIIGFRSSDTLSDFAC